MNSEAERLQTLASKKEGARRRGALETDGFYSLHGMSLDWVQRVMTVPNIVLPAGTLDPIDAFSSSTGVEFLPDFEGLGLE